MKFLTKATFFIVLILAFNYVHSMGNQGHRGNRHRLGRPTYQPQRLYQTRPHQGHQRPLQGHQRPQVPHHVRKRPQRPKRPQQGSQRPHMHHHGLQRPQKPHRGHQMPQFPKERPHGPKNPNQVNNDLFGRGRIHPSNIPRFGKYFARVSNQKPKGSGAAKPPPVHDHHHGSHVHKTETAIRDHEKFKNDPGIKDNEPSPDLSGCDGLVPNHEIGDRKYIVVTENLLQLCPPMKWAEASDFCQSKSMGLVTLGQSVDPDTARQILNISRAFDIGGFWTGGYVTHPVLDGVLNSVIWSSTETELIDPGEGYFSKTGEAGIEQPDNFVFRLNGGQHPAPEEHCVAVLNNKYNDGQVLHDLVCDVRLPVVCQEMDFGFMSNNQLI